MAFTPEILEAIDLACAALGRDGSEVRDLLDQGDTALALEVLIDQYECVDVPLPRVLLPFAVLAKVRSDLEELQELWAEDPAHPMTALVQAAQAEVEAAVEQAGPLAALGERLKSWFTPLVGSADPEPRIEVLVRRIVSNAAWLGGGRP